MFNKEYKNDHLWWNVSFSWHHIFILFKNMSFKCPFCLRTFSQRTAYSQHVQVCLRKVEVDEEKSNSETHSIDITQDINESDDNELNLFKKQHKIHHLVVWKVHIAIYYPKFNNEL